MWLHHFISRPFEISSFFLEDPWLDNGELFFPTILKMTASGRVHSWGHFSGHEWTSGIDFTLGGHYWLIILFGTLSNIIDAKAHLTWHFQAGLHPEKKHFILIVFMRRLLTPSKIKVGWTSILALQNDHFVIYCYGAWSQCLLERRTGLRCGWQSAVKTRLPCFTFAPWCTLLKGINKLLVPVNAYKRFQLKLWSGCQKPH